MAMANTNAGVLGNLWQLSRELSVPVPYFRWHLDREVTVGLALVAATQRLSSADLETPRLDSEVLLAHVLGCSRSRLYAYPEQKLAQAERKHFEALVERRFKHEPVAYLVGRKAFYGLDLAVNPSVLIPRPETELLVDLALDLVEQMARQRRDEAGSNGRRPHHPDLSGPVQVADVGTGSGAIAVALAAHTSEAEIYALDISPAALRLAQENAQSHDLAGRLIFGQGDLLTPLPGPVDLIVANLPYVAHREWDDLASDIAQFEPSLALSGGVDGLEIIGRLLEQAPAYLHPRGALLLEIGSAQGLAVAGLAAQRFPDAFVEIMADYGRHDRILRVQT